MLYQRLSLWLLLCTCGFMVGCGGGDGPELVPANGVVTFKGAPIGKISVLFTPVGNKGLIAEGTTDSAGKFTLQTKDPGDGAMVGDYTVTFHFVPDEVPMMPGMAGAKKVASPIPEKYGDANKSGQKATIGKDKSKNTFTFDLK